mmetsp:Transcript_68984/g.191029  ORF Transcript_68984/g.191029 Transcript_68984/m.191029 type:complete len:316 (-) Transcript_68984:80-1027(-)
MTRRRSRVGCGGAPGELVACTDESGAESFTHAPGGVKEDESVPAGPLAPAGAHAPPLCEGSEPAPGLAPAPRAQRSRPQARRPHVMSFGQVQRFRRLQSTRAARRSMCGPFGGSEPGCAAGGAPPNGMQPGGTACSRRKQMIAEARDHAAAASAADTAVARALGGALATSGGDAACSIGAEVGRVPRIGRCESRRRCARSRTRRSHRDSSAVPGGSPNGAPAAAGGRGCGKGGRPRGRGHPRGCRAGRRHRGGRARRNSPTNAILAEAAGPLPAGRTGGLVRPNAPFFSTAFLQERGEREPVELDVATLLDGLPD